MRTLDVDACWQAVLAKDGGQDGAFVYAVRSTGVFCRPCCPSRRPRRKNVIFFDSPSAAEQAGFRPCRRCRPLDVEGARSRETLITRVCQHIERAEEVPTLAQLGRKFGMSPFHLQRTFKSVLGLTPREYADACRMQAFREAVRQGGTVTDALYAAGYGSARGLYQRSNAQLGMTPAEYRNGGRGAFIRYTSLDSPVGRMLIAATNKGVCSIQFGESERGLMENLRREFPNSTIRRGEVVLRRWVRALLQRMHGTVKRDLPLDIQATAFQRRVWQHLQTISYGSTQSYGEVARAIGSPSATRAVARACATNPVAVAIPCHRVVHSNGDLGGYRWGIERKKKLLELEQAD
jgi:AraC family transcriptional regulator of adaptative response/methylated-DNA-[protein]-cysteine methyltransferase